MSHPYKRMKLRVSRFIDQIFELQGTGSTQDENDTIDLCVQIMQKAQAAVHNAIAVSERKAKLASKPQRRVSQPPAPPSTITPLPVIPGQRIAQPKPLSPSLQAIVNEREDDMEFMPHNMTTAQIVQAMLDGKCGSYYENEAAKLLHADTQGWEYMDDDERLKAIKAKAAELEAADPMDDIGSPEGVTF